MAASRHWQEMARCLAVMDFMPDTCVCVGVCVGGGRVCRRVCVWGVCIV